MSIESVMPSNHLILCRPLLLPPVFPNIRIFSNELVLCIRWPKYWSSASASVLPMNIQNLFPLGLTGLISLQSKGLSRVFSNTTAQKHQFFCAQPSSQSNSHIHTWLLEKPTIALTRWALVMMELHLHKPLKWVEKILSSKIFNTPITKHLT